MSIGGLVPLPSDALVTPVTFRVKKRNLRGILAEYDAAEDGTRELSGEWVVGKKTWQRLQTEWKTARNDALDPAESKKNEQVIFYIHGGEFIGAYIGVVIIPFHRCILRIKRCSSAVDFYPFV